jgi:hypothetical protein
MRMSRIYFVTSRRPFFRDSWKTKFIHTMHTQPDNKYKTPHQRLGSFLLIAGGCFMGVFIARQIKESSLGHTYWEFIIGGLLVTVLGLAVVIRCRRNGQDS